MLENHKEVWLVELQENKWSIEKRRMRLRIKRNNPCYEYLSWFYLGNKNHADFFTATQRLLGYALDDFIFGLTGTKDFVIMNSCPTRQCLLVQPWTGILDHSVSDRVEWTCLPQTKACFSLPDLVRTWQYNMILTNNWGVLH